MTRRSTSRSIWQTLCACAALAGFTGCAEDEPWEIPMIETSQFESEVYPILLRDCGFHTCHGSSDRFFRVWGPGRARLGDVPALSDKTKQEVEASYQRAISFIDERDPGRSLLLKKPLAVAAGGAGHLGIDKFGRNLYRTTDSPGYLTLSRWVYSVKKP